MSLAAIVVIAFLITVLLAKSHRAGAAVLAGVVTLCLLFAAFPALGPAVSSGAGCVRPPTRRRHRPRRRHEPLIRRRTSWNY